jgi:hypothetical protein
MPGLVPGIHVFFPFGHKEDVDGRDKPGHDEEQLSYSNFKFSSFATFR